MNAVLASSGRKGTFMLLSALARHPQIFTHDQVFSIGEHPSGTATMLECFDRQRLAINERTAIVLPASPTMTRPNDFWPAVAADRNIAIIHLRRRKMLRWYLSMKLAKQTNKWDCKEFPTAVEPAITINPAAAAQAIYDDLACEAKCAAMLADNLTIEVFYENILERLDDVQEMLGVEMLPIMPATKKQATLPIEQAITNFAELQTAWRNTPYEKYLC
jgi:hypothetical protein